MQFLRRNKMAYIRQLKNGSFSITVSCGRDRNEKKITRSTTFWPELTTAKGNPKTERTIEKEVKAFADDFEKKVLSGEYTTGSVLTFESYSQKYLLEYAELVQADTTLENTKAAINLFNASFGYMTLESLNPLFLQEYANKLLKEKNSKDETRTLSPNTVKRKLAVLSSMLSQAVRWNLIKSNPMERVQIMKKNSTLSEEKSTCFNLEEAEVFIQLLDSPLLYQYKNRQRKNKDGKVIQISGYSSEHQIHFQLKLFLTLAIFTGCRRGEMLALTWDDIDFKNSSIKITKSVSRVKGKVIIKTPKNKNSVRKLAIPSFIIDLFKKWKMEQKYYQISLGSEWKGDNHIFIRWDGSLMGLETPRNAFHRLIRNYNVNRPVGAIKLPIIPLHGLRHTSATLLLSQGIDIKTVSERLGHANASTTLNVYAHALEELDRAASNKLENILTSKAN